MTNLNRSKTSSITLAQLFPYNNVYSRFDRNSIQEFHKRIPKINIIENKSNKNFEYNLPIYIKLNNCSNNNNNNDIDSNSNIKRKASELNSNSSSSSMHDNMIYDSNGRYRCSNEIEIINSNNNSDMNWLNAVSKGVSKVYLSALKAAKIKINNR